MGRTPNQLTLHMDLDLTFRAVRDLFTADVDRLVIDAKAQYERSFKA